MPKNEDEAGLLKRFKEGDRDAGEELWRRYKHLLMKLAAATAAPYSETFDDKLQAATFHFFRLLYKWNPDAGTLSTYLYRALTHALWKEYKIKKTEAKTNVLEKRIEGALTYDLDHARESTDESIAFRTFCQQLKKEDAFILSSYAQGKTLKDIGESLGVSRQWISIRKIGLVNEFKLWMIARNEWPL